MSVALGMVPTDGRGSMPFALLRGEALVAVASRALEHAEVELVDFTAGWSEVVDRGLPLVVHDPLCAGTPVEFLAEMAERGGTSTAVLVGVRRTDDGSSGVASPVVLPPDVLGAIDDWPDLDDLPALVERLQDRFEVESVAAPDQALRVSGPDDLPALEQLLAEEDGGPEDPGLAPGLVPG